MKNILSTSLLLLSLITLAQEKKLGKIFPNEIQSSLRNNREANYFRPTSNAEVFIRIPELGRYKIQIDDQIIENSTGIFRFFGLGSGQQTLSIHKQNTLIYKTRITTKNNYRLVFDFFYNEGLFLLNESHLNNKILSILYYHL